MWSFEGRTSRSSANESSSDFKNDSDTNCSTCLRDISRQGWSFQSHLVEFLHSFRLSGISSAADHVQKLPEHVQGDEKISAAASREERRDGEAGADGWEVVLGVHGAAVGQVRPWGERRRGTGVIFAGRTVRGVTGDPRSAAACRHWPSKYWADGSAGELGVRQALSGLAWRHIT